MEVDFQAWLTERAQAQAEGVSLTGNIPKEQLQDMLTLGYSLYASEDYARSEKTFRTLCVELPMDKRSWFGLASSLMMRKQYHDALLPWAYAALLDDRDPLIHFHAGECMLALNEIAEAKKAFLMAKERAFSHPSLQEEIDILLERWAHG